MLWVALRFRCPPHSSAQNQQILITTNSYAAPLRRPSGQISSVLSVSVFIALLCLALFNIDWPVGPGFTPDSSSYIGMSPQRQPLYGLWANSAYAQLASWRLVIVVQVVLFVAAAALLCWELMRNGGWGNVAALCLYSFLCVLARFGMLKIVGSVMSEGLFYSLIILFAFCVLRWIRSEYSVLFGIAAGLMLVLMSQLRSAAILVVALPFAAGLLVCLRPALLTRNIVFRTVVPLCCIVLMLAFLPILAGKRLFQIGTASSSLGFVLLPRISLLSPPPDVAVALPLWGKLSSSWIAESKPLSTDALTQFDAQLQEAIRSDLGPHLLLPALRSKESSSRPFDWTSAADNDFAKQTALHWIKHDWQNYLVISAAHYWGTLTGANFMGNENRTMVWTALNHIDPRTWELAEFKTDYPNNRIDQLLKARTEWVYFGFRFLATFGLLVGAVSAVNVCAAIAGAKRPNAAAVACLVGAAWCLLHSAPAGLAVFPEFRFVYANLLMYASLAAVAIALLTDRSFSKLEASMTKSK